HLVAARGRHGGGRQRLQRVGMHHTPAPYTARRSRQVRSTQEESLDCVHWTACIIERRGYRGKGDEHLCSMAYGSAPHWQRTSGTGVLLLPALQRENRPSG